MAIEPNELCFVSIKFKTHRGAPGLDFVEAFNEFELSISEVFGRELDIKLGVIGVEMD